MIDDGEWWVEFDCSVNDSDIDINGSLTITDGSVDVNNISFTVDGNVIITDEPDVSTGSPTITVGGDWSNPGTFTDGNSTVAFVGNTTLTGTSEFY